MIESEVLGRLVDIVADQMGVSRDEIGPQTSLVADLGADSLDLTELVIEIEEEFDLQITDEDAEGKKTLGDWAEYIQRKKAA